MRSKKYIFMTCHVCTYIWKLWYRFVFELKSLYFIVIGPLFHVLEILTEKPTGWLVQWVMIRMYTLVRITLKTKIIIIHVLSIAHNHKSVTGNTGNISYYTLYYYCYYNYIITSIQEVSKISAFFLFLI